MRPNVEKLAEAAMGAQDPDYFSCATIALATYVQALEEERDALRKSVDQLADTLKNVHEAVCETLGIEGDDSLPELVADWAEGEYAALRKDAERYRFIRPASFVRQFNVVDGDLTPLNDSELDAAIHDAIAAKEPANGQG